MNYFSTRSAQSLIQSYLARVREGVQNRSLDPNRLPAWIQGAETRAGWINDSLVAVLDDSPGGDEWEVVGKVDSDVVILLRVKNFVPTAASLQAPDSPHPLLIQGSRSEESPKITKMVLTGERPAYFNIGYAGHHPPIVLLNVFFELSPASIGHNDRVAVRFVPLALYIHRRDASRKSSAFKSTISSTLDVLENLHNSSLGDFYAKMAARFPAFKSQKDTGVIILGKYSDDEEQELQQVRDFLRGEGYEAQLIKDFPDIREMSSQDKVRFWTHASRFCVMVDRTPSGHIAEYEILKQQGTVLALLRQRGSGSTYMIGDDPVVNINYFKLFEFDPTPLAVLPAVVEWAENFVESRRQTYDNAYPWRDGD